MSSNHPRTSEPSEAVFKLIVRSEDAGSSDMPSVEMAGVRWTLVGYDGIPPQDGIPGYGCISYSWGAGRTVHPFDSDRLVSDRSIPAIEAAIKAKGQPRAIWIDSLCVPAQDPARAACLRQMGTIYGAADRVTAVLSRSCAAALHQIDANGHLDLDALPVLDRDDWVSRAWTYQEIANSKVIHFVAEGSDGVTVDGEKMLNALGSAIDRHKKTRGIETTAYRSLYPRVDGLEDLLGDYMIANCLQRFAYQVMAAMHRRFAEREGDSFNAMIGALTSLPPDAADESALPAAERFMRLCEAKGDYSFIYCVAPRSKVPGRTWRPTPGSLPPVLCWHTWGDGQPGALYPTHLALEDMCRLTVGAPSSEARETAHRWLQRAGMTASEENLAQTLLRHLRSMGFTGSGDCLELEGGYFFPQSPLDATLDTEVLVAKGVRWVHGAPALLVGKSAGGIHAFRDVGVFVGPVPTEGDAMWIA